MTPSEERKPGPYAVSCREHGLVYLTEAEYDAQMDDPDEEWRCPHCGRKSEWSDENFDRWEQANS
jgi:hypothetical protein